MAFPASCLLPTFILGVLAIDLTFDVGGLSPATVASYYAGHRTAGFPANTFVIAAIVFGSIPLFRNLAKPQLVDWGTLVVMIINLIGFVGYLIPIQEELLNYTNTPTAPRAAEIMAGCKYTHLAMVPLCVLCILLQQARKPDVDAKKTK